MDMVILIMDQHENTFESLTRMQRELAETRINYWLENNVLTWGWWLTILLLIAPWFIWWRLVDRRRLTEMLSYIYISFVITIILDSLGSELSWWAYPNSPTPFTHALIPYNLTILPVIYSLVYQYVTKWKPYILVHIALCFIFSFIAEPLLKVLNLYVTYQWKSVYSLPIYLSIAIVTKWIVGKWRDIQVEAERKG